MVSNAKDLGELRAIADILGHSPEMLLNVYSHALPKSQSAVVVASPTATGDGSPVGSHLKLLLGVQCEMTATTECGWSEGRP